jgi:isopentenyl diphosphate isomerase/L-lactate dehydrogenase-like FMN-dependent dehydrogenase
VKKLKQLANKYSLKLILKGINEEKDVELAHNVGVDALWISNHGGRQLDTSPAGI